MALSPQGSTDSSGALSGYTQHDVNFGRLYKAATQTSKRVLKAVLLVMLPRSRVAQVESLPTSVADYCTHVLGWSNTKFRSSFSLEERTLLQEPAMTAEMDVSLLSKLLHKLFGDLSVPDAMWRELRNIKNVRNRVCHEHLLMDDSQLAKNLNDLKVMYETLLDQANEIFAAEMDDFKKTLFAEIEEIMSSPVAVDASEYLAKVEQFRIELVSQFIWHAQRELIEHYAKLEILNPFTWLSSHAFPQLQVGKIFTPLLITEQSRNVETLSLLATEVLSLNKENASGVLPGVLVLTGIAGSGKTSLCRYLLHDWCTKEGAVTCLRSIDVLLHIEARNITSSSLVSFLQKALLPKTCSRFMEKDIIQVLQQVTVLYVIDGIDEATAEAQKLLKDVFTLATDARILITTRPEFTSSVTQLAEHHHMSHMTFKIHGFSEEGRKNFVDRVFTAFVPDQTMRQCQEREFLRFLKTSCQGLTGHLKLPLTLALLVCLWRDDKTRIAKVTSATRLYAEIFRLCTSKMATRLQTSTKFPPPDLQGFVKSWLVTLGREAYNMLDEGRLVINDETQRKLDALCEGKGLASLPVFSTFLQCEVSMSLLGVKHDFCFVHKSQMEYLAALYLCQEVIKAMQSSSSVKNVLAGFSIFRSSLSVCESKSGIHDIILFSRWGAKWVNTWLFVVGHLSMNKEAENVLEAVLDAILTVRAVTQNENTMWRLIEESGRHPLATQKVGAAMSNRLNWRPSDAELCDVNHPMLMLMQHTSFSPQAVYLRVVGSQYSTLLVDDESHPLSVAYHSLKPIITCLSQRPSCLVFLRLDEQFYTWGGEETADDLLGALQSKGNLVNLMGHLGLKGAKALTSVNKMGELLLRVTEVATLEELARSLLAKHRDHVDSLILRLDLPWNSPIPALPRLHATTISLVLARVNDGCATTAAHAVGQLFLAIHHLDLVTSSLTKHGAYTFISALETSNVTISGSLTIRSSFSIKEDARLSLQAMLKGGVTLQWWS